MAVRKPVKFRNGLNVNEPSTFGNIFVTGGNVGIGKTAPSYVLDILGDINLSGQLFQSGSSFVTSQWTGSVGSALSYTSGIVIMTDSSISNLTVNSLLTTNISATNITVLNLQAVNETVTNLTVVNESIQNLIVSNDVSISDNLIALGNSNTVGAIFTTGGNVGIGISAPNTRLDVGGTFEVSAGSGYMFFNSAGNLGLNTTSANWEFTINGPSSSYSGPHIWITNNNNTYPVFQQLNWDYDNISLNFDMYFDGSWRSSRTGTNFQILKYDNKLFFHSVSGNAGSSVDLIARLVIGSSGNIGIGTETPSQILQVGDAARLRISNSSSDYTLIGTKETDDSNNTRIVLSGVARSVNQGHIEYVATTNGSHIFYRNGVTESMRISSSGNVGINKSSPAYSLDINGDLGFNGTQSAPDFIYANGGGDNSCLNIRAGSSAGVWSQIQVQGHWNGSTGTAGNVSFWTASTQRMRITDSGNVGIGTASPQGILDVVGSGSLFAIFRGEASDVNSKTTLNAVNANSTLSPLMSGTSFFFYGRSGGTNYRLISGASTYFTGQHGNQPIEGQEYLKTDIEDYVGLIVSSADEGYVSVNPITNQEITGKDAIQISESLPKIKLSNIDHDKAVWGVITNVKNENYNSDGTIEKDNQTEWGDRLTENTIRINGLGEGAIWVTNKNGNIINGDYITSSSIPGYGQRQNSEFLANYTVAKATCSVDFTNLEILNTKYNIRFINGNGTVITEQEYNNSNENVYIAAFIGCSYHCS